MNQVMRCEKCGGVIAKGKEAILTDDERRIIIVAAGQFRVTLLKHANEADCLVSKTTT
jgi:hypothetical protein